MAFALKFTGMKWEDGGYVSIPIPGELPGDHVASDDTRFRQIDVTAGYLDYFAILSVDEAIYMAFSYHNGLTEAWLSSETVQNSKALLNTLKHSRNDATFIVAHLFEWNSGY